MLSKIETIAGIISRNINQRLGLCTSAVNLHKPQLQLQSMDHLIITGMRKLATTDCNEDGHTSAKLLKKYVLCECGTVIQERNFNRHLALKHGDACMAEEAKNYIKEEILAEKNSPHVKELRGKLRKYILCRCGSLVQQRSFKKHLNDFHYGDHSTEEEVKNYIKEEIVAEKDSPRIKALRREMYRAIYKRSMEGYNPILDFYGYYESGDYYGVLARMSKEERECVGGFFDK